MSQKKSIQEKLDSIHASVGDIITLKREHDSFTGALMPHHSFSGENIITLKLSSGYNIGLAITPETIITLEKKADEKEKVAHQIPHDPNKPTVSIIGTGGTIACYIDYRTGAVHPATSSKQLAYSIPEIFELCNIDTKVAYQLLSEHTTPQHWQQLAELVAEELNKGTTGVIIPHGTDTMGYTAAALSFMLGPSLPAPVVLVGSQRSSDRPSSDSAQNLLAAATVATQSDIGEVVVVMHSDSSDSTSTIHRGTRTRKFHTSRRDAFKSINDRPIGIVDQHNITYTNTYRKTNPQTTVQPKTNLETDVSLLYSYPGIQGSDIPKKKGIVMMGTGLGHIPEYIMPRIKELIEQGSTIAVTSQCLFGRTNLAVYSTGRDQLQSGLLSCEDMLPETAYVKLMWTLANSTTQEELQNLMTTNLTGEISERSLEDTFF